LGSEQVRIVGSCHSFIFWSISCFISVFDP